MYNRTDAIECLRTIIGWRNHWDTEDIPPLQGGLNISESGEYYQDIDPKLQLNIISSSLEQNRSLDDYLANEEESAIVGLLNDFLTEKKIKGSTKGLVSNDVIYNTQGWATNTILNQSYFVGVMFRLKHNIGIKAIINRIALQLTQAQTALTIYIYHSHKSDAIAQIDYTTATGGQFNWIDANINLSSMTQNISGGTYYVGYYQDDMTGKAIEYKKLNWQTGYCNECGNAKQDTQYNNIAKDVYMCAFYIPTASLPSQRVMFDPEDVREVLDTNWGFNFNVSVVCDLTDFICVNKLIFTVPLKLKMQEKVFSMLLNSNQINAVDENSKAVIYQELNSNNETNQIPLREKYKKAIKALNIDTSALSNKCLDCYPRSRVTYSSF